MSTKVCLWSPLPLSDLLPQTYGTLGHQVKLRLHYAAFCHLYSAVMAEMVVDYKSKFCFLLVVKHISIP